MSQLPVVTPATRRSNGALLLRVFMACHEALMDRIQAGRADDAYDLARLLAYVGPRL